MKCKHENADHLKPGEPFEPWFSDDTAVLRGFATCEQFRCLDCEAWLSLGPSNDELPEVQIEIEAARIQHDYRMLSLIMSCPDELLTSPIGYLARVIAHHLDGAE
jgi:hypothetical protein